MMRAHPGAHPMTAALERAARALCVSFDMDPDELEAASEATDELVPRWKLDAKHARAAILAFLDGVSIEYMARAIQQGAEQNGGPPYDAIALIGCKHALGALHDEARAALSALRDLAGKSDA